MQRDIKMTSQLLNNLPKLKITQTTIGGGNYSSISVPYGTYGTSDFSDYGSNLYQKILEEMIVFHENYFI